MEQLIAHLAGDYCLQNQWMADNKINRSWPCAVHCLLYTLPFLLITHEICICQFVCLTNLILRDMSID
jgi:hypothetical protein